MTKVLEALKVTDYHVFKFVGWENPCSDEAPHVPHVRGYYSPGNPNDDAWEYEEFCKGKEGYIPGVGYLYISIWEDTPGDAETPHVFYGYWYIKEEK